jgi:hypothetical protein
MANNVAAGRAGFIGNPHCHVYSECVRRQRQEQNEFWPRKALRIKAMLVNCALGQSEVHWKRAAGLQNSNRPAICHLPPERELEEILA